jgi:hydroxyethylthiazole kinase-like uncharacterized protein yjeF
MKILNAEQIKEADTYTIKHEPISSVDLMERAALKCVDWIIDNFSLITTLRSQSNVETVDFQIFCGIGNNGGDGLVIARHLHKSGFNVTVYAVRFSEKSSKDFQINERRLIEEGLQLNEINSSPDIPQINDGAIVIDAIFGSGLSKPIEGFTAELIEKINSSNAPCVAIDIPSGLFCEDNHDKDAIIVRANHTLTFQVPKLSFLFPQNSKFVGHWTVLDIGLHLEFLKSVGTNYHLLTESLVRPLQLQRAKFSHKGSYGHSLLISGSKGKMGATVLAAKACLRSGAGLLTVHAPECGYAIVQTTVPEAMLLVDSNAEYISELKELNVYNAIGVGPGLGDEKQTANTLKLLIQNAPVPLVIDADAINLLAENKTWLAFVPPRSIYTPHPKEFQRLVGTWDSDNERLELQIEFSRKNNAFVVLKGAHTSISCPDGTVFFNSTGNPGMATAGSGDVLTGIITGLMAQGYSSRDACVVGVYLHGLAGDIAAAEMGYEALMSSDIIDHLGKAFIG